MTSLELAIVVSAVDNASRVISQVQKKLDELAKAGESMKKAGERMTFAGRLLRAAGDALGFADSARSAMSFQDEVARVNTVLPPTTEGIRQLGEIQELPISRSRHACAAEQVAESVYMGLSSFLTVQQAMAATTVPQQTRDRRAPLDNLAARILAHRDFGTAEKLTKAFSIRGARDDLLIQQLGKLDMAQRALDTSTGAAVRVQQIAESTASPWFHILKNNLEAISEMPADQVLPTMTRWINDLSSAARVASVFLAKHQTIAKVLAYFGGGLAAVTTGGGGLLLVLGPITIAGGYALKFSRVLGQIPQALELIPRAAKTMCSVGAWALDAAMPPMVVTIGGIVIGAAAPGLAAYKVYPHWSKVKKVFFDVVDGAEAALGSVLLFVKHRGVELLEALVAPWAMLPTEIFKHIDEFKNAAEKVAHTIARFFVGHSPIPEGPLRDLNLARTIAMMLPPPPVLAPAMQTPGAIARPLAGAGGIRGGSTTFNVNYNVTVNGSGSASAREEWVKSARQHADELMRIINVQLYRQRRLQFE
jgi:hypothetical protein